MTNITWKPNANGYWNVAANWSGGVVPGAADNVTLTSTARHTVYFTVSDTVAGLISTNDMLGIASGDLTVTGPTNLAGGFSETGGTLTLLGAVNTLSGGIAIGSGDIVIGTGDVVTLAGAVALGTTSSPYGAHIYGAGRW